jgi:hypothetical protein
MCPFCYETIDLQNSTTARSFSVDITRKKDYLVPNCWKIDADIYFSALCHCAIHRSGCTMRQWLWPTIFDVERYKRKKGVESRDE